MLAKRLTTWANLSFKSEEASSGNFIANINTDNTDSEGECSRIYFNSNLYLCTIICWKRTIKPNR